MASEAPIFEKIYNDYLSEVTALELTGKADTLGIQVDGKRIGIPFFHKHYTITPDGITDQNGNRPPHAVSVILCKYLLLCPENPRAERELVTYKDFKNAAPYVIGFRNTAESPISRVYSGKIEALEKRCRELGGKACDVGISCDLSYVFNPLPEVPIYLFYNDEDEDFPADCSLLFERRAEDYLDMECLAMIGMVLAQWLGQTEEKDITRLT